MRPTACVNDACGVPLRPGKRSAAEFPGTRTHGGKGLCVNCHMRARRGGNTAPQKAAAKAPGPPKPQRRETSSSVGGALAQTFLERVPPLEEDQVEAVKRMIRKRRYADGDELIAMLTGGAA